MSVLVTATPKATLPFAGWGCAVASCLTGAFDSLQHSDQGWVPTEHWGLDWTGDSDFDFVYSSVFYLLCQYLMMKMRA